MRAQCARPVAVVLARAIEPASSLPLVVSATTMRIAASVRSGFAAGARARRAVANLLKRPHLPRRRPSLQACALLVETRFQRRRRKGCAAAGFLAGLAEF